MFGSKRALIGLRIAAVRDQIVKKNKCGTTAGLEVERKSPKVAGKAV